MTPPEPEPTEYTVTIKARNTSGYAVSDAVVYNGLGQNVTHSLPIGGSQVSFYEDLVVPIASAENGVTFWHASGSKNVPYTKSGTYVGTWIGTKWTVQIDGEDVA